MGGVAVGDVADGIGNVLRAQARRQASPVTSVWREPEVVPESGAFTVLAAS